jgi:hypothetical protein
LLVLLALLFLLLECTVELLLHLPLRFQELLLSFPSQLL